MKVEVHWLKIQHQLEFLRKVWSNLDEDYQTHQNTVLQVLQGKVTATTTLIDRVIGSPDGEASLRTIKSRKGDVRRAKYALWAKDRLNDALADLKDWSEIFDMSWFLLTLQPSIAIDNELSPVEASDDPSLLALKELRQAISSTNNDETDAEKTPVFLSQESFAATATTLRYSSLELRFDAGGSNRYIFDYQNEASILANVCNLAKRLKNVEPAQFGIPRCHGVLKQYADGVTLPSTRFVFFIPSQVTEPQTLRELEVAVLDSYALDERFVLAKQLAKAVMFVHSAGFVHKNIRPETIIVSRDADREPLAMLLGFRDFRLDEGRTLLHGDDLWEANLYRHPTRQGIQPEESYVMQHDIYSLGVCLFEIGIGGSLVLYDSSDVTNASSLLEGVLDSSTKDTRRRAFGTKRGFIRMAKEVLPAKMGRKYTEIVLTCLTCLDKSHNAFGFEADFLDENGLLVGVRFIEKVREECCDCLQMIES